MWVSKSRRVAACMLHMHVSLQRSHVYQWRTQGFPLKNFFVGRGGGGGFRLKPQMKVSFVWMWPYRILDARAQKECSWRVVHVLLQISWLAGALRVIIAALATSRASLNPNNLRQVRSSIFTGIFLFSSCVVCWWHEVWAPFQGRRTTLSLRSLGRENCLQSLDVAFSAPNRKSSFLRVLHSCEGGRRLALLQGDSRVGRARIRKILALAEWELSSLTGLVRYWMPNR